MTDVMIEKPDREEKYLSLGPYYPIEHLLVIHEMMKKDGIEEFSFGVVDYDILTIWTKRKETSIEKAKRLQKEENEEKEQKSINALALEAKKFGYTLVKGG